MRRLRAWLTRRWFYDEHQGWHPRYFEWRYSSTRSGADVRHQEADAVHRLLEPCCADAQRVLEIGSGTGSFTLRVAHLVPELVAVDCSRAMTRFLRRRLARSDVTNVILERRCLPDGIADLGRFDGVFAVGVLNYIEAFDEALRAIAHVLTPNGWCVLTVPADNAAGRKYRRDELSTRRRVYLHSDADIRSTAEAAGLHVDALELGGEFTRVFRARVAEPGGDSLRRPRRTSPPAGP